MAITKIQTGAFPADVVTTASIDDLSVTHAKLHTDMDLSSKTVTLPSAITDTITNKLPLTGGTLTGPLIGTNARFDNTATTPVRVHINNSGTNDYGLIYADTATAYKNIIINPNGGNVGIGTASPTTTLDVNGGGSFNMAGGGLKVLNNGTAGYNANIFFGVANQSDGWSIGQGVTANDGHFRIYDNGAGNIKMTITDAGNVGIGIDSPSGKVHIGSVSSGTSQLRLSTAYNTSSDIYYSSEGGHLGFYQRQYGSSYQRFFDIAANGDSTWGGNIRFLTNYDSNVTTKESLRINDRGALIAYRQTITSDGSIDSINRRHEIWANGPSEGTYRRTCAVQNAPSYNTYSWYKIILASSVYGRGGSIKYTISWSTTHAAGSGICDGSFAWRGRHNDERVDVTGHKKYNVSYINGTYYGWSSTPNMTLYESSNSGGNACLYMRVQGHIDANGSSYDGGVVQSIFLDIYGSQQNTGNQGIYFVGHSTPGDAGGAIGDTTLS